MKTRWLAQSGVWLAVLGICLPQVAFAAAPASPDTPPVVNIALGDGGVLHGRVVNLKGAGVIKTGVSVKAQDQVIARDHGPRRLVLRAGAACGRLSVGSEQ